MRSRVRRFFPTLILSVLLLATSSLSIIPVAQAAPDTLVLLHPHSADVANHVITDFQEWYESEFGTTITVQQITMDSGASYQQVQTWGGSPEADVMWGGGEYYLMALARKGFLEGHQVADDANIEDVFGGWPLKDPTGESMWYAAALSTFGIMWNEDYLDANGLTAPGTWGDLTDPQYNGHIVMCDPAKSGSTTFIVIMVIEHFIVDQGWENNATGWQNAWQYWAKVAGNVGLFTESSHAVPTKVVTGEYGIGICIDYYAWEQIKAGENVGWASNAATSISADPAGILKGAPNPTEATRWMDYLTSKRGQEAVGNWRMPIREDAAPTAPVLSAWYNASQVPVIPDYSRDAHNAMFGVTREMFSFWLVKNHEDIKAAQSEILEAEDLGLEDYEDYSSAVQHYNMVPEATDSLVKALAVDPDEEAAAWETWGATHFGEALTSAQAAIAEYEQKQEQAGLMRTYTYIGAAVAIVAVLAVIYLFMRRS